MKLIGYPCAGRAPWAPLDTDDIDWMTAQDLIDDYKSRGINYSKKMVSVGLELYNLNSKMLCLRCRHEPTSHLQARWDFLWREKHRLGAELNPPVYAVGDVLEYRMFLSDDARLVRITGTGHFDFVYGRVYSVEVVDAPDVHLPGAVLEQLLPAGIRHIESEIAKARGRVASAHSCFYNLGAWRNQRTRYQRQEWQRSKLNVANAERELYHLLTESKTPDQKLLPPIPAPARLCHPGSYIKVQEMLL